MPKPEEEWARRVLSKELSREVVCHDDGTEPGMYDLRAGPPETPTFAVECTSAHQQGLTETLKLVSERPNRRLRLSGDWLVCLQTGSRVVQDERKIEGLLQTLEGSGITRLHVDDLPPRSDRELYDLLKGLKIDHLSCYQPAGSGKVFLYGPSIGGTVDHSGNQVAGWIGDFLRDPSCEDNLKKLRDSGAPERHMFVVVAFGGAPFSVESYLRGDLEALPAEPPDLPAPVTGVWIASAFAEQGIWWNEFSWRRFNGE